MNRQMSIEGVKSALHACDPSRFLSIQKGRKVMKTVNAFKVTILCGFITILVLRGTMQAGSGLPDTSIYDDAERFQVRLTARMRMLQAQEEEETPYQVAIKSEFVAEEKWDGSSPYKLGPKISNWDYQRIVWNERNPYRNRTREGKPKIMLVSGSQPGPCANPMGDFYHLKFLKNRIDYARIHGMEFYYNVATFQKEMNSFWAKLPLLRTLMLNHPEVEWFWWMDSDAVFTDMTFEIDLERYKEKNIVAHGFSDLLFDQHKWLGLNTGSFLIRNCQWSLDLLDAWAPFGPAGETRINAGKMLTAKLVDRPAFEADDQSALVYLMLFGDMKWKTKMFLEWAFFLHGYWKFVVYNYENVIAKNKPGAGGDLWPFVTHFVGCKPCQYAMTGEVEECFKQMERAFNFADNQVLGKYGYSHRSLSSSKTMKIREDTTDPLGLRKGRGQPVKEREQLVKEREQLVKELEQPVKELEQPVKELEQPVKELEQPVKELEQPVKELEQPVKELEQPVKELEQPVKELEQPVKEREQPVEHSEDNSVLNPQETQFLHQMESSVGKTG